MPQATVSTEPERFELQTCPGGYVTLRRMPYGQLLERREMAAKMAVNTQGKGANVNASIEMMQRVVAEFEAKHCIVEHNLEDAHGAILNLKQPGVFLSLDPRIGSEISGLIDKMNQFEEVDAGNSATVLELPSS